MSGSSNRGALAGNRHRILLERRWEQKVRPVEANTDKRNTLAKLRAYEADTHTSEEDQ